MVAGVRCSDRTFPRPFHPIESGASCWMSRAACNSRKHVRPTRRGPVPSSLAPQEPIGNGESESACQWRVGGGESESASASVISLSASATPARRVRCQVSAEKDRDSGVGRRISHREGVHGPLRFRVMVHVIPDPRGNTPHARGIANPGRTKRATGSFPKL